MFPFFYLYCFTLKCLSLKDDSLLDEVVSSDHFCKLRFFYSITSLLADNAFLVVRRGIDKLLSYLFDESRTIATLLDSLVVAQELGTCYVAVLNGVTQGGLTFLVLLVRQLSGRFQDVLNNF